MLLPDFNLVFGIVFITCLLLATNSICGRTTSRSVFFGCPRNLLFVNREFPNFPVLFLLVICSVGHETYRPRFPFSDFIFIDFWQSYRSLGVVTFLFFFAYYPFLTLILQTIYLSLVCTYCNLISLHLYFNSFLIKPFFCTQTWF